MKRFVIPFLLVVGLVLLLSAQCTLTYRWRFWGVVLELLPALLLYASFTVNLPTALLLGILAAIMYDSFSVGNFGSSMVPYIVSTALFCAIRPVFFRNRITTQFVSGILFGFTASFLQWALGGKWSVGLTIVLPKLAHLSLLCGILAVIYFTFLDMLCRMMGLNPGRFEE